jgi:hypothetical protein
VKVILRVTATILAVLSIALGAAGAVRGADPTVGGTLSADRNTITVFSNGNVPAHVYMSAEFVTLSEADFELLPGEQHSLTFTGKAVGYVKALYVAVPVGGTESGTVELAIGLEPTRLAPVMDLTVPFGIGLTLLALIFIALRVKPWQWRIYRSTGTSQP